MIKTLAKCIGKYKKESIITPIFTAVEVFLEILIPFITASIIDKGIQAGDMRKVGIYGGIMLVIAFLSLFCGIQAGKYAAAACSAVCYIITGLAQAVLGSRASLVTSLVLLVVAIVLELAVLSVIRARTRAKTSGDAA